MGTDGAIIQKQETKVERTKQSQEELRRETRLPTDKESLTDSEKRPIRTSHSVRFSEEPIVHIKTPECSVVDSLPSIRPPSHPNTRRRKIRPFYNPVQSAVPAKYMADKHSSRKYVVESPELNFNYDEDSGGQVTERTNELAKPKNVTESELTWVPRPLFYYSCGRPSMIWEIGGKDIPEASGRVEELSNPKRTHPDYKDDKDEVTWEEYVNLNPKRQYLYSCGRVSPIWKVSKNAQSAGDRPRTQQLSMPRPPHGDFQPSRQVETIIPPTALSANATERLQYLSTPKKRPEGPFREPEWTIPDTAKNANASNRSLELARPKGVVDGYQLPRDEMWPVSRAAKRTSATQRIQELSRPIVRASMDHVQFNPEAFVVKQTALKGVIPRRVEELAQPITRG